jgi:uncharacterized protein with HEPN domain
MSRNSPIPLLDFMLEYARQAISFVDGMTQQDFDADAKTQAAVAMCLINVGESAGNLSKRYPEIILANPQVAWREITDMRNRIAHDYGSIDFVLVWETLQVSLPPLIVTLPGILHGLGYFPSDSDS